MWNILQNVCGRNEKKNKEKEEDGFISGGSIKAKSRVSFDE